LGVGAAVPSDFKDGLPQRRDPSALERLKVQLLGKKAAGKISSKGNGLVPQLTIQKDASKPSLPLKKPARDDSEDEDEGRASAVVAARSRPLKKDHAKKPSKADSKEDLHVGSKVNDAIELPEPEQDVTAEDPLSMPKTRKDSKRKASSFMDEILAEKARKKKKKKKKQEIAEA
jgi:hypothetical protein